jgi:hypothetical protein
LVIKHETNQEGHNVPEEPEDSDGSNNLWVALNLTNLVPHNI